MTLRSRTRILVFGRLVIIGLVFGVAVNGQGSQAPALAALLDSAASYVATYEEHSAALVFEERYQQRVTRLQRSGGPRAEVSSVDTQQRQLRSEVVVLSTRELGWLGFRDVVEVDGRPIPDRHDRLLKLFSNPQPDAVGRAGDIAAESARFNLGSVRRTMNYPTMALIFGLRRPVPSTMSSSPT